MFKISLQYFPSEKGFKVNPKYYVSVTGETLTEILSKFILEVSKLKDEIFKQELKEQLELHGLQDDDIPF